MTKDNKNVNIWEILKERNEDLVAEIEKLREKKGNRKDLILLYEEYEEMCTDKIEKIREKFQEYDKISGYGTWRYNENLGLLEIERD